VETHRIPLLWDHHTHPLLYAAFAEGLDLGQHPTDTRAEAVERIRAFRGAGAATWGIAYGWNTAHYPLRRADFDGLAPLVVLNLSLHGLVVNGAGRERLGRTDPEAAARIDDQHWVELHLQRVLNLFASEGGTPERLQRFFRWLLEEHGVFHAEELLLAGANEIALFDAAGLADRTTLWAPPAVYDAAGAVSERIRGVKLFTDGAVGARTAALGQTYRDGTDSGMLVYGDAELEGTVGRYLRAGRRVAVHAIGDRAIDQAIAAVAATGPLTDSQVRIEHAQFISAEAARRARSLGIVLSMQPNFSADSVHYRDRLPAGFAERNNPFRMLIDEAGFVPGVDLLFGSDGMPHGARAALQHGLLPPFASQALTMAELVAGYCMPDQTRGAIEVAVDHAAGTVECRVDLQSPSGGPLAE